MSFTRPSPPTPPAPINYAGALSVLFPDINFLLDVELRDDGNGLRIARWNRAEPQPTEEALRAVVIPESDLVISDLQARLWLNSVGLYEEAVQSHIETIPDQRAREDARVTWDRALTIHLSNPLVQSIGTALGLNSTQLRQAFIAAQSL